jgi:hypothetical protein
MRPREMQTSPILQLSGLRLVVTVTTVINPLIKYEISKFEKE